MSVLYVPPCPTDCTAYVADVSFNDCAPETHWGEISKIYITGTNFAGFLNVAALGEWTTNLSDTADDKIRTLIGIGDLAEAETTEIPMSGDRIAIGYKTFTINFEIDETNETNYNFLLMTECGGHYLIWFETSDGILYGGNDGIEVTFRANLLIPRGREEMVKFMTKSTWKSQKSPFRVNSPMA